MSKREVVGAAIQAIGEICQKSGYSQVKTGHEPETFLFSREEEHYICSFSCSFSGRGEYSISNRMTIVYKALNDVMLKLMRGTAYERNYNFEKPYEMGWHKRENGGLIGVGITTNFDGPILYIASVDESRDFALKFHEQLMEVERNFILPAKNIENTIAGFMKKRHWTWPGLLPSFIEHLVAYGLSTSNSEMIDYAFKKGEEVLTYLKNPIMYSECVDFMKTVKERLANCPVQTSNTGIPPARK
ncbi:MAG: hypothetical protein LBQ75_01880 [Zoogloeaceae bacterium]|jgi:hypothetical protein|nr:hypothetical protein [Zoogloeaceae bacterium]